MLRNLLQVILEAAAALASTFYCRAGGGGLSCSEKFPKPKHREEFLRLKTLPVLYFSLVPGLA